MTSDDDTPSESRALTEAKHEARLPDGRHRARVSKITRIAIDLMAREGLDYREAALRAPMHPDSLRQALYKPHIKEALNQAVRDVRENAGQAAHLRIIHMSQQARAETVRLDANKWVAGVDNIAPVRRVEARHQHNVSFGGFAFGADDDDALDITPDDDNPSLDTDD